MNIYLCIIIGALLLEFMLFNLSHHLDLKNITTSLPNAFKGYYSESEYARSQEYLMENTRFSYLTSGVDFLITNGFRTFVFWGFIYYTGYDKYPIFIIPNFYN